MFDIAETEEAFCSAVAAVRTQRDVIEADGPDATEYLHGQLSQDIEGLEVGTSSRTLLLQPQGKIDAWLRITRLGPTRFWLDVEPSFGEATLERLMRFKLRVDAELTLHSYEMVALRGPDVALLTDSGAVTPPEGGAVLDALWPGVDGLDIVGPRVGVPDGIAEGPAEALTILRVRLGLPAMGAELTSTTIPAAAGIVDSSVDFTKGCYVGQELVARIDSRGNNTPTRLRGLVCADSHIDEGEAPPVGSEVVVDGDVVGSVTSSAHSVERGPIGLAFIKRGVAGEASAEVTTPNGNSLGMRIVDLPIG